MQVAMSSSSRKLSKRVVKWTVALTLLSLLITLGGSGSMAYRAEGGHVETHYEAAVRVKAADTTAAGDTYTGYFIAGLTEGKPLRACMNEASRAAAIAVTRPGAAGSIPWRKELDG